MNENISTPGVPADTTDLQAQITSLKATLLNLQIGTIALVWIVGLFLFIQVYRSHKDVKIFRPQINQVLETSKREDVDLARFTGKLSEYARSHPDIVPVLARHPLLNQYGLKPTGAPAAPAKPAAPQAPKK